MTSMALAATLFGPEDLRMVERPLDPLAPGMVRIRFGAGLRLHIYKGFGLAGTITGAVPYQGTTDNEMATPFEFLAGPEYRFAKVPVELIAAAAR